MYTLDIYENNKKIETKLFEYHFYIIKDQKGLYWETGEEGNERIQLIKKDIKTENSFRGGSHQIWIRAGKSYFADIHTVLPEWRLILDDELMEQGFYMRVYVSGKKIELLYGDYRFVCTFPLFEGETPKEPYDLFSPMKNS